jgi:hypothetical protein
VSDFDEEAERLRLAFRIERAAWMEANRSGFPIRIAVARRAMERAALAYALAADFAAMEAKK